MKTGSLFFFLLTVTAALFAQTDEKASLANIRDQLQYAFNDEQVCNNLHKQFKNVKSGDPLLNGYVGGLYIARSRHAPLFDKMNAFKTGTSMLEEAIKLKPNNIELLFLRMTIQLNLPRILNYNDNISSDKKFVLEHYNTAPPVLKSRIINFVKTSGFFSDSEQEKIIN